MFLNLFNKSVCQPTSLHPFKINTLEGVVFDMASLKGKKVLLVNTASECGFTSQYKELQELYDAYKDKNFTILAFPSNNFKEQEKGSNEEIKLFCQKNFGITFPIMEKINVKGDSIHPIYNWLTHKKLNGVRNNRVKWNFQKYMINEKGELVGIVNSWQSPMCRKIVKWIEN